MIYEYGNERFKEVRLQIVRQALPISQILSIQDERIGASHRFIRLIEAFASWSGDV